MARRERLCLNTGDKLRICGIRIADIAFKACVVATLLTLFTAFTPLIFAFYILCLLVAVIITLGTVFLMIEDFGSFFVNSTESMGSFTQSATKAMPFFAAAGIIAAIICIVLYLFEIRTKKHTEKIAVASVCAVLTLLFTLFSKAVS